MNKEQILANLNPAQTKVYKILARNKKPLTLTDIKNRAFYSHYTIANALQTLRKLQLITYSNIHKKGWTIL
jgi:DNA-binding transcriptional regulator GbsR (MarR family)